MEDKFGRDIYYLRLSVTDLCNLRCVYCMPEQGVVKRQHCDILSVEEIEEIVRATVQCGIRKVRVTGGEPLVRRGIVEICRRIAAIPEVEELCMTTNGTLLTKFAAPLKEAGVSRLNISLDTLDKDKYAMITRGGKLKDTLDGIAAAVKAGFKNTKINAVLIGGVNDTEIRDLLELTRKESIHIRFIELMPIGECAGWSHERFIGNSRVLETAPELQEVGSSGVAKLYKLPGGTGTVGLISPISSHFCPTCNRIRVTADGKLKPCLHSAEEVNLRGLHGQELLDAIRGAVTGKPQRHHLDEDDRSLSRRNMNAIGG
ncbi:cyclic pyranopterin phosphate synthase [Sporobacter termitidis DSM 10068]|uniref:GTP 3',8-cyclase n=1 Tax=Sporobacter termitidis DSM 10068 TaxID=1123282 RepID=A0A1M5VT21_9FIRM|nr:GTP 3',8-cyclase MoaA [Sporobacter termitidis]SHH78073.1 cyclic pyranopterin phosphate synthase [Sporobacter termitidis DSM 10068]